MRYLLVFALVLVFLISCAPMTNQAQANTPTILPAITDIISEPTTPAKTLQPILVKDKLWIDAIAVDSAQTIWLIGIGDVTDDKYSLINYDSKDWRVYEIPTNMVSCYANAPLRVANIAVDANGSIWGNSGCKIFHFDGKNWTAYSSTDGIAEGNISALAVDHTGNIWLGIDNGTVSKFDKKKWVTYNSSNGANLDTINSIILLPDNTLWFGGLSGISHFDGNHWATYKHQDKHNQPIEVREIAATKDGEIWVLGWAKEASIYYFNGNDWKDVGGIENLLRMSIFVEQNGNVWVGAWHTLFYSSGKTWLAIPISTVMEMAQTQDGTIWFGTQGGLYRYNPNK